MRRVSAHSIRAKLLGLVLLTTTIALVVAGIAMLANDLRNYRHTWTEELDTEAQILALSTAPALAFDDRAVAERNLRALQARPGILAAALYGTDGSLYAQYVRAGQAAVPLRLNNAVDATSIVHGEVRLTRRLIQNGEWLGTLYLAARYDILGQLRTYVSILVLIMLLSMAVVLLISQMLQRSLIAPLETITAVARQIVRGRDYSPRVPHGADDEIGLVIEAFNSMLDEIQSRTRALEQSNRSLQDEVGVRQAAETALARSNETLEGAMGALRETDRRKDEFLATLAHELRNPLAPIRHAVKLLSLPSTADSQRQWAREVIARQVERMALLLDDLLDVSRITQGRLELKKEYVALSSLVASAVETARPLIDAKRHALMIFLPDEPLELEVDALRLSQALANLLTNAAKYTDEGGRIELRVTEHDDALTIAVSDNGIGVSAAALPTLFEMFSQVESAIDRAQGGLGIGLALVKGLVGLHGGSARASSAGPGQGSTFSIDLPRRLILRASAALPAPKVAAALPTTIRCRILVADDNHDAADSLALILRAAGHEVHLAYSGLEAWQVASALRPDVLLLDIGMPGMSGYELARRVRQEEWGRAVFLLAATGWGQRDDKDRAQAAGFDHHLTKPVNPDQVLELLNALLSRRRADSAVQAAVSATS
jgi:signal transduction histidine kinase/CheY-like chemotaxis protein